MSKRPPQRPSQQRVPKPANERFPFTAVDPAGGQPPVQAGDARLSGGRAVQQRTPVAASREELVELLGGLREQGNLGVADEAAILREYDGLVVELRAEKTKLESEFRERLLRDGQDETNAWLAEAAEALGRRQGEQMRQLIKTIPGFTPAPPA